MEEEILNYFNSSGDSTLAVLDNRYRHYYTGVTLNYITYDLLKAKYRKSDVAKTLIELLKNKSIKSLWCGNVKNYVFENLKTPHWKFNSETGTHDMFFGYNIYKYLNTFIKNE